MGERSDDPHRLHARIADLRGENKKLRDALSGCLEWMEEEDPYPTSDGHPIHEAREALKK
jgi:hypothetical protein